MSEDKNRNSPPERRLTRRGFLKGVGTGLVGTATLQQGLLAAGPEAKVPPADVRGKDITRAVVSLKINGKPYSAEVEPRTMLLSLIRDKLGLTGTKSVCERGECGACTVIMNGKTVYSCMVPALEAHGAEITTVEGLSRGDRLHPVQEEFIKHDGYQCGFCTSGFELALKDLLDKNPNPDLDQIKQGLSGNICRCGAYPHIFEVALELAGKKGGR
ncbi:MAG: (2Fe-2S)-binding protein [Candidatus Glassbacteria bacterium]|nr:(2Fe-2S)-binding protein [Candidatus Glassbacteria bacterium]